MTVRLHSDPGDDRVAPEDSVTRELRALYAAPADGYWDDLEGRILAAVRASAARPGRAAADWWQALAGWARPGLAAAAVLLVIAGSVAVQARVAATSVASGGIDVPPQLELQPVDELARAIEESSSDPVAAAAARAAQEAAYLLTGGLKRRPPVQLERPAATPSSSRANVPGQSSSEDELARSRREATFRYLMPD